MIHLGYTDHDKRQAIEQYCTAHGIEHVVTISPEKFPFSIAGADNVTYESTIMYVTFYRLLQEIHPGTLIVLSECLRTQNRYDLTLNEAAYSIFYENEFKYAHRLQAEDRNHRIGQERRPLYIDIWASCKIEDRIASALASKGDAVADFRRKVQALKKLKGKELRKEVASLL